MKPKRLNEDDIHYLSFQGGGGAGNAYPGALYALQDRGLLQYDPARARLSPITSLHGPPTGVDWRLGLRTRDDPLPGRIRGVSGASAGAINALFVSLGYTPAEMEQIVKENPFTRFFDTPIIGLRPHVGGFRIDPPPETLDDFARQFMSTQIAAGGLLVLPGVLGLGELKLVELGLRVVGKLVSGVLVALDTASGKFPPEAVKQLTGNLGNYVTQQSFVFDYGLFPGETIRKFFGKYISLAVERAIADDPRFQLSSDGEASSPQSRDDSTGQLLFDPATKTRARTSEITFRQHREIFGVDLLTTGTNLETTKTHFFSADTTPNFRVVDAIRISMSIPIAFKPMIIHDDADLKLVIGPGESVTDHFLRGVWVDGGLMNNIPIAAFDDVAGGPQYTLALAVGSDARYPINNVFEFMLQYPIGMALGTGNSQISATTMDVDRVLVLPISDPQTGEELGMFEFQPEQGKYDRIKAQSQKTVEDFFATRVNSAPRP